MEITFGKWQGWDTNDLAKAGEAQRDYLRWGAANLQAPKWRKEFADALKRNQSFDQKMVACALHQEYDDLDDEDIDRLSVAECQERDEDNRRDAQMQACIAKHAAIIGTSAQKLERLYWNFFDDYKESQFSSHQKFEQFDAFVKDMASAFDLKGV